MRKYNGFVWIETVIAITIFFILLTIILPIYRTVQQEKTVIRDRSLISQYLYEELFKQIYEQRPIDYKETTIVANRIVTVQFLQKDEYIKGCVTWNNVNNRDEELCLYGLREQ